MVHVGGGGGGGGGRGRFTKNSVQFTSMRTHIPEITNRVTRDSSSSGSFWMELSTFSCSASFDGQQ